MIKKIIVGLLLITVISGAAAAFLSQSGTSASEAAAATAAQQPQGRGGQSGNTGTPVNASVSSAGEAWSGSGTILELSDVGMTLGLADGSDIFVELGPADYWQAQGVTLLAGAKVTVDGFFNGTNYHARAVIAADGAILAVRSESGQPLWAGGNSGGTGSNGGQGEVQIPADQWVIVEGAVTALTNNGLVIQTSDGQPLTVSFGRVDFWQQQAVTFAVGDAISLLGFWQGDQFTPGQVTKTATDERILLRDPNGRPLWAGLGRGQGNGKGNGGQRGAAATATAAQ
jgi:hypothetical protein